ncbi:hypothetical protein THAOC_04551 [Thalassiosira oceanica]|uniref:Uncharacterized protein n=1 Tax=Thalassiosira oceanica TaxID=159749 RepID=K0T4Y2_THAOC|nr:hypothetical protein THAOC_04551 [Thalassiosira oceanica]|eukprot:EJK73803.1 hypothetical protein THAOC_04551 [Thalassiosira oceanica]
MLPRSAFVHYRRITTRSHAVLAESVGVLTAQDAGDLSPGMEVARSFEPTSRSFEPQADAGATIVFFLIAIVFTLLQLRISAIAEAATHRSAALERLRLVESRQLSNPGEVTAEQALSAKNEYEQALTRELDLRTVVPGVRVVAPRDPQKEEEQRAAAKRFLGWSEKDLGLLNGEPNVESDSKDGMSNGSQAVLLAVGLGLLGTFLILCVDPMTTLSAIAGGPPPVDLPASSW